MGAGAILGIGAGLVSDELNDQRAQGNAYDAFVRGKQMTDYNRNAQLGLWQDTGYGAQVKQMKEAGLNPALMYKGAGSGGSTALAVGSAQKADTIPSKIGEGMALGLQADLQKAQIDNIKADTAKKGAEKTEVESRTPTYAKGMELTDSQIKEIASKMGVNEATVKEKLQGITESESRIPINQATVPKILAETAKSEAETWKIKELTPLEADRIEQEVKSLITRNKYLDSKERQELNNMIVDMNSRMKETRARIAEVGIKAFAEEIKANYPSLWNVGGKQANQLLHIGETAIKAWFEKVTGEKIEDSMYKNKIEK